MKNAPQESDYEAQSKEYYEKFMKLPDAKNKTYSEAMKDARFKHGKKNFRIDMRPKVLWSNMKIEIILFIFGVGFALSKYKYFI